MKKIKLVIIILSILCLLTFFGCESKEPEKEKEPEIVNEDPQKEDDEKEKEPDSPTIETYIINYDLDGGAFIGDYPTSFEKESELIIPNPVKEGFVFSGWRILGLSNFFDCEGKDSFTIPSSLTSSDIGLKAVWKEIKIEVKYTITYENLGEANLPSDVIFEYIEGTYYKLPNIYQDDFNFLGWSLDSEGKNIITEITSETKGDLVLYANWEYVFVSYSVEYDLDGGDVLGEVKYEYNEGETFYLPKVKKDGYRFLGWTEEKGSKNYINDIVYVTGNLKFYANFEKVVEGEYLISYVYEDGHYTHHTATSPEEFIEQFWKEFYEWCDVTITLDKFIEANMTSWKAGNTSKYNLYLQSGKGEVDDRYFINAKGNEAWMKWMDIFDEQVTKINKDQTAWNSTYVGLLRLYNYLNGRTSSYWKTEYVKAIYEGYPIPNYLITKYNTKENVELIGIEVDDGRDFLGWVTEDGIKVTNTKSLTGDTTLYASWSASTPVTSFNVTNITTKMYRFDTLQLEWIFNPLDATNQKLKFISSDNSVISVDEEGKLTALKVGSAKITVVCLDNNNFNVEMNIDVVIDPFIDIKVNGSNVIGVGEELKLSSKLYGENGNIEYRSLDNSIVKVESGKIIGVSNGYTKVEAFVSGKENIKFTFGVTVSSKEDSFFKVINNSHNANIHVTRKLPVAYVYDTDVFCSASDLLFNYKYEVDRSYEAFQAEIDNNPNQDKNHGGKKTSNEFICVHYTAGASSGSTGRANANYFATGGSAGKSSIHYTTGNDGIYHILDDTMVAWHAGDGTGVKFEWIPTGVKTNTNDKPTFGVVKNTKSSTGYYFTVNGVLTSIEVPIDGKSSSGAPKTLSDPLNAFTYFGPSYKIENGEIYMGTPWACFTQVYGGVIGTRGGNNNSIGIETACNKGSDLWLTYQMTAELVARLMDEWNLDISRVVGHNAFTGKDCPQTLLYNNGELWELFIECVQAEFDLYEAMTKSGNYTISAKSSDPSILSDNGRVVRVPNYTTSVEYTVTIKNNSTGEERSQTYCSIINGAYTE